MSVDGGALRDDVELRRRRRAVLRAHHPDLGGDPVELLRRLRNLGGQGEGQPRYPEVSFVRQATWRQRVPRVLRRLPKTPHRRHP
jgi:hypothetical protein